MKAFVTWTATISHKPVREIRKVIAEHAGVRKALEPAFLYVINPLTCWRSLQPLSKHGTSMKNTDQRQLTSDYAPYEAFWEGFVDYRHGLHRNPYEAVPTQDVESRCLGSRPTSRHARDAGNRERMIDNAAMKRPPVAATNLGDPLRRKACDMLASIARIHWRHGCPTCSVAPRSQAPKPHRGAPKARGCVSDMADSLGVQVPCVT